MLGGFYLSVLMLTGLMAEYFLPTCMRFATKEVAEQVKWKRSAQNGGTRTCGASLGSDSQGWFGNRVAFAIVHLRFGAGSVMM
jgi:hypothetical protein